MTDNQGDVTGNAVPPAQVTPPPLPHAEAALQPASRNPPPKRPLTFGQKVTLGLVAIGLALVAFAVSEAKFMARHPHHFHH